MLRFRGHRIPPVSLELFEQQTVIVFTVPDISTCVEDVVDIPAAVGVLVSQADVGSKNASRFGKTAQPLRCCKCYVIPKPRALTQPAGCPVRRRNGSTRAGFRLKSIGRRAEGGRRQMLPSLFRALFGTPAPEMGIPLPHPRFALVLKHIHTGLSRRIIMAGFVGDT